MAYKFLIRYVGLQIFSPHFLGCLFILLIVFFLKNELFLIFKSFIKIFFCFLLDAGGYACNPSYSGGRD
jgi:hypothetical protein